LERLERVSIFVDTLVWFEYTLTKAEALCHNPSLIEWRKTQDVALRAKEDKKSTSFFIR
jgi:hypothetical protein